MRRHLKHVALSLTLLGCGPTVRNAGYTTTVKGPRVEAARTEQRKTPPPVEASDAELSSSAEVESPPPRESVYAEVPPSGTQLGAEGPISIEGLGRSGLWVSYCSIPSTTAVSVRGTATLAPHLHLFVGSRTERIDALLRADEQGRYLVVLIDGVAWLVDALSGRRLDLTPLSPDLRADSLPDHRSFAFTEKGLVVLSQRTDQTAQTGYYLSLFSEGETAPPTTSGAQPIDWGKRHVWRIDAAANAFFATTLLEGATPKNWPVPPRAAPVHRCASPTTPYPAYERVSRNRPDPALQISWALAPSKVSPESPLIADQAPGFVAPFGEGWVRREDSGRLVMVSGKTQKQIASARCGARVLRADVDSGLFLITCEEYTPILPPAASTPTPSFKSRFELHLIRPGFVRSLKADLMRTGVDFLGPPERSLFPIRPGSTAALVDFNARKLIPLSPESYVLATSEKQALLRRGDKLILWTNQGETTIEPDLAPLAPVLTFGAAAAVGDTMYLLGNQLGTWKLPGEPLRITPLGYALIPKKAPAAALWPDGPLLLIGPPQSNETDALLGGAPKQ